MADGLDNVPFLVLDVENLDAQRLNTFLRRFREEAGWSYTRQRPVLPTERQTDPPQQPNNRRQNLCVHVRNPNLINYRRYFDIILRYRQYETRARLQRFDLYLRAYRRMNQWQELARNERRNGRVLVRPADPLLFGGIRLGFDHTYDSLRPQANLTFDQLHLGRESLITAVRRLATSEKPREIAHSLLVVIQMLIEAARFIPISDYVASTLEQDEAVPSWMENLEHNWETLSNHVTRADADANYRFAPLDLNLRDGTRRIETIAQLREVLGVLQRDPQTIGPQPEHRSQTPPPPRPPHGGEL